MDPNTVLIELREAVRNYDDATTQEDMLYAADALATHVAALDEWLTRGGFLPTDWARNRA